MTPLRSRRRSVVDDDDYDEDRPVRRRSRSRQSDVMLRGSAGSLPLSPCVYGYDDDDEDRPVRRRSRRAVADTHEDTPDERLFDAVESLPSGHEAVRRGKPMTSLLFQEPVLPAAVDAHDTADTRDDDVDDDERPSRRSRRSRSHDDDDAQPRSRRRDDRDDRGRNAADRDASRDASRNAAAGDANASANTDHDDFDSDDASDSRRSRRSRRLNARSAVQPPKSSRLRKTSSWTISPTRRLPKRRATKNPTPPAPVRAVAAVAAHAAKPVPTASTIPPRTMPKIRVPAVVTIAMIMTVSRDEDDEEQTVTRRRRRRRGGKNGEGTDDQSQNSEQPLVRRSRKQQYIDEITDVEAPLVSSQEAAPP